jgi:hypothetical protein
VSQSLGQAIALAEQQLEVCLRRQKDMLARNENEKSPASARNEASIQRLQTEILALLSSLALARAVEGLPAIEHAIDHGPAVFPSISTRQ